MTSESNLKISVAGEWLADIYEEAIFNGLRNLGHSALRFSWIENFRYYPYPDKFKTDGNRLKSVYFRFQNKFRFGPEIQKINQSLVDHCLEHKPDLLFIYRGTHIFKKTLQSIKRYGTVVMGYNNDDPFSAMYPSYVWRHYMKCLPAYDYIFAYRKKNLSDYERLGFSSKTELLRSYYINGNNHPVLCFKDTKTHDVVFIGHYENDGRDKLLKKLIDSGIPLRIFGTNWQKSLYYDFFKQVQGDIVPVYKAYNDTLASAKVAIVFLSKLNHDSYTRRCFEIPAAETCMLSEYSDDLASMFSDGREVCFFRNGDELVEKARYLLENPEYRKELAVNGRQRLLKDGHECTDRARQIVEAYTRIKSNE